MKNTLETRLGMFVALAVIAAVILLEMVGGSRLERGYHYYALFSNVQDLKIGDRVKIAGVEVGQVENMELAENKVKLTLKVHRNAVVRTDSTATIKFAGLMGQNYVSIDFGTPGAPQLTDGAPIQTAEQPDLNAMMAKLNNIATGVENLTKSFSGDKIDNLLGPLTDFLKANRGALTATIANFQSISTEISEGKGTVGKLIYDPALYDSALSTMTKLEGAGDDIKGVLGQARSMIDQVNAGQGTLGKLVKDETLYNETTESMTNLKEILQKINHGQGSVGKLVNDQEFYKNAKVTLQKLDKATDGLEDQGPISVLGILINNLL